MCFAIFLLSISTDGLSGEIEAVVTINLDTDPPQDKWDGSDKSLIRTSLDSDSQPHTSVYRCTNVWFAYNFFKEKTIEIR